MILPNLAERIAWYQERMRPEDPAMGAGISDWTITSEYVDDLRVGDQQVWGCMGSPTLGGLTKLTPEDIQAKRAHIVVRTPKSAADLPEVDRTILHELGHVLVAPMQSTNRAAEENAMHSLDFFFSKLSPEEGQSLARGMQTPMARAYRAGDGKMPDQQQENKEPDKPAEKPAMQVRSVAEIEADLVKASLAGQPVEDLVKELIAAKIAESSQDKGSESVATPPEPVPTMGMKPEEAYQRGKKEAESEAEAKAVKAYADTVEGLTDDQRAMVRKMPTIGDAQALVKTYPRQSGSGEKMGMQSNPKLGDGSATVRTRALQADPDVMARIGRAASNQDTAGLHLDVPGHILAWSPTGWLQEQYGAFKRAQKGAA